MERDNFISILTSMTEEDIREMIKAKGKEPKLISPYVILKEKENKNGNSKSIN